MLVTSTAMSCVWMRPAKCNVFVPCETKTRICQMAKCYVPKKAAAELYQSYAFDEETNPVRLSRILHIECSVRVVRNAVPA